MVKMKKTLFYPLGFCRFSYTRMGCWIENGCIVRSMSDNGVILAQTNRPKNWGDIAISEFRRIDILRKPLFI